MKHDIARAWLDCFENNLVNCHSWTVRCGNVKILVSSISIKNVILGRHISHSESFSYD